MFNLCHLTISVQLLYRTGNSNSVTTYDNVTFYSLGLCAAHYIAFCIQSSFCNPPLCGDVDFT